MDNFQKKIKKALDNQIFDPLTLSETEVGNFISTIKEHPKESSKKQFALIIPSVVLCLVLLISFVLLKPYFNGIEQTSAAIEKQATEEFGQLIFIPRFENYPITFAGITKSPINDTPVDLTISYGKEQGKIEQGFANKAERQKWEKEQGAILLYGPYQAKTAFSINYRPGHVEFDGVNEEEREINGVPFMYDHVKKEAVEFVTVSLNAGGGVYFVNFIITEDFTLSNSEKVLEEMINQIKKLPSNSIDTNTNP
ncbi:hypothetical protein V1499_10275 [Neobacillus sp. SCS-31]|uniref:hypothetical protein n=1 Tax=Neobacillus oceani TaxID=3115292 RepID=UPI003905BC9F